MEDKKTEEKVDKTEVIASDLSNSDKNSATNNNSTTKADKPCKHFSFLYLFNGNVADLVIDTTNLNNVKVKTGIQVKN